VLPGDGRLLSPLLADPSNEPVAKPTALGLCCTAEIHGVDSRGGPFRARESTQPSVWLQPGSRCFGFFSCKFDPAPKLILGSSRENTRSSGIQAPPGNARVKRLQWPWPKPTKPPQNRQLFLAIPWVPTADPYLSDPALTTGKRSQRQFLLYTQQTSGVISAALDPNRAHSRRTSSALTLVITWDNFTYTRAYISMGNCTGQASRTDLYLL